jgi:archaellum component FlaC
MSEDFTAKLPKNNSEVLTAIKNLDTNIRGSVDKLVSWIGNIDSRLRGVEEKLERVEKKVEERLYDTRPIWHRVIADIAQLQAGQQRLEKGMDEVGSTVRTVSHDQIAINDSIRKVQLDFHMIDNRLQNLELNS